MESEFLRMVKIAGLPQKGAYTLSEVSKASGVPASTLREEVRDGSIKSFLPRGRVRGSLIRPDWFDEWWKDGTND